MLAPRSPRLAKASAFVLGTLLLGGAAFGQAQPAQPGGGAAGGDDRQQRFEQFRKQASDRMKTLLQASDDEFAVLWPRIEKLQQLQSANDPRRVGMMMLLGGGGAASWRTQRSTPGEGQRQENNTQPRPAAGGGGGGFNPFGSSQDTAAYQRARDLQAALEAKEASPELLKAKLADLRAAKQKSKEEFTRAQEELRQLCSVRQEAVLVMMGLLE